MTVVRSTATVRFDRLYGLFRPPGSRGGLRPIHIATILALVALFLAPAGPARADLWYEHYAQAEEALAEENWTRAVDHINAALAKKGDPGARVRTYGMRVTSYFPYLKLGIAYYHLDELDAALRAFETEEQLGAIRDSAEDLNTLETYRARVLEAKRGADLRAEKRIDEIVQQNLRRAAELETAGDLDGAIAAVGQALAVRSEDAVARRTLERLRGAAAERAIAQENAQRAANLVGEGRTLLATGHYDEASSLLRQALSIRPSDETRDLLEQATSKLREQVENRRDAAAKDEELRAIRRLETTGDLQAALTRMQSLLALEPTEPELITLHDRLAEAKRQMDEATTRSATIAELLAETEVELAAGHAERSLATVNRVLAIDPGNSAALDYIAAAYRDINQRLLGTGPRQNIPPAIRFADLREELDDASRAQRVRNPEFQLNGVIIDESPVEVMFHISGGGVIQGSATTQPLGDLYITEFRLDHDLEPGLSTVHVVATDDAATKTTSEYAVLYRRPFFRAPAFYTSLAGAVLLVGALIYARRARRRKQRLTRRFNPYVAGAPVLDTDLFFGRERLLQRILQTIHNNSLLLHGERRIGKTTLQHHLKRRLEALEDPVYDFYPVYVDLQGTPENRFFSTLAEDLFDQLGDKLDGLEPSQPFGDEYPYRNFVRDLRDILKALRLSSAKRVKLVLLIDEVDELNDYDPKVNQRLRSLFMKSFAEDLVAVVSGVQIKRQWEREGSPWYNFFEEIEVEPFAPGDAHDLIVRPLRGTFRLEEGLVERLFELSGGRPYQIQRLCIALVNRMHDENRRRITLADLEALDLDAANWSGKSAPA